MEQTLAKLKDDDLINPYHSYEKMREQSPILKKRLFKQSGWFVTGYKEAKAILTDSRFQTRIPLPITTKKYETTATVQKNMVLYQNPPDHKKLREIMSEYFTTKALANINEMMEKTTEALLREAKKKKTMDVVAEYAFPLASSVIASIIGVPEKDKELFRKWAYSLVQTIDLNRNRKALIEGNDTVDEMVTYFHERMKTQDMSEHSLLHGLMQAKKQGKVSEDEIVSTCILLLIAGHETTVNLISNLVYCFAQFPDQYAALQEHPTLVKGAVEECLRFESPTQLTARVVSEDCVCHGVEMKKGEQVYIMLGAANRDPAQFKDPNLFVIKRTPNAHLTFGAGQHFCIGSMLARLEAEVAIETLKKHLPCIKLEQAEIQWRTLAGFRALEKLTIIL
ncbi:cytochrome P450 [Alkalihalobacillus sp. LMS39]|uniref:cytochrome P450 n=1 Tax=Alkalihalobacillus sp. LMS39 TaxID=2924032 RepID=UPI001FB46997|nr:cytochrome P450 [Alkalihalobacillus sp. LMS39]UOE95336.1 cytochrome P450 [Alkalihalobacillus sp. LMS39]